jgi:hypothetical protein
VTRRLVLFTRVALGTGLAAGVPAAWLGCADLLGIQPLTSPADAGDASAGDAGHAGEAGPASDAGDWCRTHAPDAEACEDFDEIDALPPDGWGPVVVYGVAGEGSLDDAVFESPPRALTIAVPTLDGGSQAQWWLQRTSVLPAGGSGSATVSLSFDVRLDAPVSGAYVVLGGFVFGLGTGNSASVELLLQSDGLHLVQGSGVNLTDYGGASIAFPTLETWTRLELDLTLDAGDGEASATVEIGGNRASFETGTTVTLASLAGLGAPIAGVGNLITLGAATAQSVHVDDVVIDLQR